MSQLSEIDKLQTALKVFAAADEMTDWWSQYGTIKYQVEDDKSASKYERDTVEAIGTKLTNLMTAIRDKLPSPDKAPVVVLLGALRGSIANRTVGADGYKSR
jgi:hypothetical protein